MERKKKYTVEEATAIILRDVPSGQDESDDLDIKYRTAFQSFTMYFN